MSLSIDQAMKIAIEEALKGAPFVSPNPKVGCVILDSAGNFLSKGYHTKYGQAHAEVEALKGLSETQLKGAHVIVTLEPCAHQGKTPSCARYLATLPIKKVTFGFVDPNPLVVGQGAEIIRAAGIQVQEYDGELKTELEEVCEEFLWNFRQKRVFVAMKVAQSLDGKIALSNGQSQWITGPESREKVHELRANYDAIVVGKGTVLQDDPSLNVRHPQIRKENKVIILDRRGEVLKLADTLKIFKLHKPENIFICVDSGLEIQSKHAQIIPHANLNEALQELYRRGIRSLMIEGGRAVYSSFLKEGLVQRLHLFTAPILLGKGKGWSEGFEFNSMEQKQSIQNFKTQQFGVDTYATGVLRQ